MIQDGGEVEKLRRRVAELEASLAAQALGPESFLRSSLDEAFEGIQIVDAQWRYVYVNGTAVRHAARSREELIGRTVPEMFPGIEKTDAYRVMSLCMTQRKPQHLLTHFKFPDGRMAWFDIRVSPVPAGILVLSIDVTLQKAVEEERETLRDQSIRDPLTGLFNRRFMEEFLEAEIVRAERGQAAIGLLMMDVDRFKVFNDTHGHEAGDVVLRAVGDAILEFTRASDIACRFGGEEMVAILPGATLESARVRAESIRAAVAGMRLSHRGGPLGAVTLSAGVSAYPVNATGGADLIRAADQALYRAKNAGRNRVECAT